MFNSRPHMLLTLSNVLIPIAVLVFATGFFPYKPFIQGLAQFKGLGYGSPPVAQFDKVIFMVVDALRSDFVYSDNSGFAFTQSLIRSGEAIPFTAHATSPTITMPRVKAITTGSIPSFLDVILNFAESDTTSTLANQDTWLAQIHARDGRLVMYGDDTWLKLFPHTFSRADGTSSFFVSDFTEVDNNVTRHVNDEIRARDWDAWIMHYLGLDHIGHKTGPNGPNMLTKQREMDAIVQRIYEAMITEPHLQSTLFILCGDHGMNDGGNHGGSAPGETSPALVFMSPEMRAIPTTRQSPIKPVQEFDFYSKIEQSDIAPTIAGLLGFPVPLNSLGVFIQEFLPLWHDPIDQIQLLLRNSLQILDIVKATFPGEDFDSDSLELSCGTAASTGAELACLWREARTSAESVGSSTLLADSALVSLYHFCRRAQEIMSSTASNYDVSRLVLGIALAASSLILAVVATLPKATFSSVHGLYFLSTLALYGVMMFASSYVEEEQQFWYWMTVGWLILLRTQTFQKGQRMIKHRISLLILFVFHRIMERWNQTGQKYAGAPDIAHEFRGRMAPLLWVLILSTYATVAARIAYHLLRDLKVASVISSTIAIGLCIPALVFKSAFTASDAPELLTWLGQHPVAAFQEIPLLTAARVTFLSIVLAASSVPAIQIYFAHNDPKKRPLLPYLHDLLTLLLITQTRAHNIPLYLFFILQHNSLRRAELSSAQATLSTILFGHVSFFALGSSNAISSIDLSNGYNGVSGYNVAAVGLLVFISNWAGPIWWSVAGVKLLAERSRNQDSNHSKSNGDAIATRTRSRRPWVSREHEHLSKSASARLKSESGAESRTSPLFTYIALWTLFTSGSLLAVMLSCTLLRTHLFIWTVFSPKYLYSMAWTLGFQLLIVIALSAALWKIAVQ